MIQEQEIPGVLLLQPVVHGDDRGHFFECYRASDLAAHGVPPFVQCNQSRSAKGTVRGLHYQIQHPQGKLVRCLQGRILDVAVDLREGPTKHQVYARELAPDGSALYVPPGFAHGFQALEDDTDILYHCTDIYYPPGERGIRFDDPALGIQWPITDAIVSEKDRALPFLGA